MAVLPQQARHELELADIERATAQAHGGGGIGPMQRAPLRFPLELVLDPLSKYVDVDTWPFVYQLLGAGDAETAGTLVRNEINRRWFTENGVAPESDEVELWLEDPLGNDSGAPSIRMRIYGNDLEIGEALVSLPALARARGGRSLDDLVAEVSDQTRGIGDVVALEVARDNLAANVPDFDSRVRANFARYSLAEIRFQLQQARQLRERVLPLTTQDPSSRFAVGLVGAFDTPIRILASLHSAAEHWHASNQPEPTYGETYREAGTDVVTYAREQIDEGGLGYVKGTGAYIGGFLLAISEGVGNLATFGYQETNADIVESYRSGDISSETMEDLSDDAAVRAVAVGIVTVALTVATAGLGSAAAGGLGLARGTAAYGFVATGTEGALVNVGVMAAETVLTEARPSYGDPTADAIWGRGSRSGGEFLLGAGLGFAGGIFGMRGPSTGGGGSSLVAAGERGLAAAERVPGTAGAAVPELMPSAGGVADVLPPGAGAGGPLPKAWEVTPIGVDVPSGLERYRFEHANGEVFEVLINAERTNGTVVRQSTGEIFYLDENGWTRSAGSMTAGAPEVSPQTGLAVPETPLEPAAGGFIDVAPPEVSAGPLAVSESSAPLVAGPGESVVWVNTRSRVYHEPQSRWFENTAEGTWMTRSMAEAYGFRPAGVTRATTPITQAVIDGRIAESAGASPRGPLFVSARAQVPSSTVTAIMADTGENLAYHAVLKRGEYGLQRPLGSNVPGVDFITFSREFLGGVPGEPATIGARVYLNDAKVSGIPNFPAAASKAKATWLAELDDAIAPGRLDLGDPVLEQAVRDAVAEGRVYIRQIDIDMSARQIVVDSYMGPAGYERVKVGEAIPAR